MFISSFLQPSAGGQGPEQRHFGLTFRQRGRVPRGRPFYRQYPCSEQKQWEAKVKVKETGPTCNPIWLFPVTLPNLKLNLIYGYFTTVLGMDWNSFTNMSRALHIWLLINHLATCYFREVQWRCMDK